MSRCVASVAPLPAGSGVGRLSGCLPRSSGTRHGPASLSPKAQLNSKKQRRIAEECEEARAQSVASATTPVGTRGALRKWPTAEDFRPHSQSVPRRRRDASSKFVFKKLHVCFIWALMLPPLAAGGRNIAGRPPPDREVEAAPPSANLLLRNLRLLPNV